MRGLNQYLQEILSFLGDLMQIWTRSHLFITFNVKARSRKPMIAIGVLIRLLKVLGVKDE